VIFLIAVVSIGIDVWKLIDKDEELRNVVKYGNPQNKMSSGRARVFVVLLLTTEFEKLGLRVGEST
jgi:transcription elongation factor